MEDFGYREFPCEICDRDPAECICPPCRVCEQVGIALNAIGMCPECVQKELDATVMREVEIHPAHIWTCEDCGRDNFERGVTADFLSPEEYRDLCVEMGVFDPAIDAEPPEGALMMAPSEVTCRFCDSRFKTIDVREENEG